jgi:hypothetical protein
MGNEPSNWAFPLEKQQEWRSIKQKNLKYL